MRCNPSHYRRTPWPLALLLLSLTACDSKEAEEDTLRVKYGETWRDFDEERIERLPSVTPRGLWFCGTHDPIPNAVDDETSVCINVTLDEALLGTGPATLTLEGTTTVPVETSGQVAFTPGAGHSPGVVAAWANTGCFGAPPTEPSVQQVKGQLVLEHNSDVWLSGRLKLQLTGTLAGSCPGSAAEADIEFDLPR
ncbi:hypothetical protein [Pyxidicoccus xibeiensis]|uniref:hypothetical protein n=1 Tax=Pyxidicoccus xibeiensis TaxID=2906759 RepID=UPI0020A730E7|nr:hypothetical protein [Pyxidicoccus xibeiensis]MCP3144519.1 hypothetical protein [Pyxidicoccus xibeiensis]